LIYYKPLRVEEEFAAAETDEQREAVLDKYLDLLKQSPGFQLVVKVLRDIELEALNLLANGRDVLGATAQLLVVNKIRRCLSRPPSTDPGEWENEFTEDFVEGDD
jgi:hypothetical protein